jgi:predicted DNA-binding transcriptional regulator AlpA
MLKPSLPCPEVLATSEGDLLLTLTEVRTALKLSRTAFYKLRTSDPTFPATYKIGLSRRIKRSEFMDWIAKQTSGNR